MRTTVLKFGSSALRRDSDLGACVDEVYQRYRRGQRVIAVVSAIGSTTDELLARAGAWAPDQGSGSLAALLGAGEAASVGLLGLALERAGVPCETLDGRALGICTRGPLCEADPVSLDRTAIEAALARAPVVIAPGFVGVDAATERLSLLGRGGSDLTAVFLASQLGARCTLIKDVDGVYDTDPNATAAATRYRQVSWTTAERVGAGLIQLKALHLAQREQLEVEVTSFAPARRTLVGAGPDILQRSGTPRRPLRIALLGRGVVGAGVHERIASRPDLFELIAIAVRRPHRHAAAVAPELLTEDPWDAIQRGSDVTIELIGGIEPAGELIEGALRRGSHVITANKALLAERGSDLESLAHRRGLQLAASAAVGGSTPAVELVDRLRKRGIERIDGVLNGTTSFILDEIASGSSPADAIAVAQQRGFAEADCSLDLSGEDLRHKLTILARRAWGNDARIEWTERAGITEIDPAWIRAQRAAGRRIRLIGSARGAADRVLAATRIVSVDRQGALGAGPGAGNALSVTLRDGAESITRGVGAGRWPTAAAVFADLLELASAGPQRRVEPALAALEVAG